MSDRFVCATLDWWPHDKCDYGRCPWGGASSLLSLNLSDPLLVDAAKLLSPFYLRLGGSLSDSVTYEEADGCVPLPPTEPQHAEAPDAGDRSGGTHAPSGTEGRRCASSCSGFVRDERQRVGFRGGCLSRRRWAELSSFCTTVGCELILSVNALRGRTRAACGDVACRTVRPSPPCCTQHSGSWDGANTASLLRFAAERGDPLAAVAYGNEISGEHGIGASLRAGEYAAGLQELRAIVKSVWARAGRLSAAPRVIGPNAQQLDLKWMANLLAYDVGLTTVSHHVYPLGAGSASPTSLLGRILRPEFLDKLGQAAAHLREGLATIAHGVANDLAPRLTVVEEAALRARGAPELWVTEMGGAYNSGSPSVTDAFASSLWFADALGLLALHGTRVVCRQSFVGGNYNLLNLGQAPYQMQQQALPPGAGQQQQQPSMLPRGANPDFWVVSLWRRLMGDRIFPVVFSAREKRLANVPVRAYAACAAVASGVPKGSATLLLVNLDRHSADLDLSPLLMPFRATTPYVRTAPPPAAGAEAAQRQPPSAAVFACDGETLGAPRELHTTSASDPANRAIEPIPAAAAALWEQCMKRCEADARCRGFSVAQHNQTGGSGWGPGGVVGHRTALRCSLHAEVGTNTGKVADRGPSRGRNDSALSQGAAGTHFGCFERRHGGHPLQTRHEWRLTARSLDSHDVLLNGSPMRLGEADTMHLLRTPHIVEGDASSRLRLQGRSVGFFLFPEASWPECM